MSKLWAGRTSGEVSSIADDFNSSIRFDCKLYKQDITGSMAHAAMLGAQGIISQAEAGQLIDGLQGILSDLESGALEFDFGCEDIHMFVEQVLTQRLGDVGKKLHTARSRNDQVALDLRMYLKDQIDEITALVKDVLGAIVAQAENNKGVIMPGYTHLQRAQPILFSHHLMAYAMMLLRDLGRLGDCRKRMNVCPIGSCARAGTTYPTDRRFEARKLGFDDIARNSIDGVSDRDFCVELMSAVSILMMHLSRFSEEIILWASWRNLTGGGDISPAVEQVISHYAQMGIKGFKIDFFDRDDQLAISSTEQLAACAAKHHMLLDLHGLKPFGIQRAYPNILNFEGVKGLENSKWEPIVNGAPLHDFPRYDVTAPYLRQLAGPMDYTPGAMVNTTRSLFRSVNDHPMSQGTRVHQMAMYTVFEAPLQMLADSPSKYMKEQECTDFIAKVPTTFDETIALDGKIAEYITIARRKGNTWFVGSMTNWTPRSCTIDLSFLSEGNYEAEIFADGINADREATDYKKEVRTVTSGDKLNIHMAPGGGWTARIWKR